MIGTIRLKSGLAFVAFALSLALAGCGRDDPAELLRSASGYQAKGDHHAAIIQAKNVVQRDPGNREARLLLGTSSLAIGDPASAEKELRRALELGEPEAAVLPWLAIAMIEAGAAEKVVQEFGSRRLDDAKADAELRAQVGGAQLRLGKQEEARASLSAATARDGTNLSAQMGLIRLAALDGKLDDAVSAASQLVSRQPDSVDGLRLLSGLKLASGDGPGARAALEKAVALAPWSPGPRFELISLLLAAGQVDEAAEQLGAARAARIADLRLSYFEALIALGRKDLAKARELSQQVLKRAPEHVAVLVLAGTVELQDRQFAIAEGHLQKALSIAPTHRGARLLLARSYLSSRQPQRAIETLRPVMDLAETSPAVAMLAGEAYLANGDLRQAAGLFETAARSKAQQPLAKTRIGQIALLAGDVDEGVRVLEGVASGEAAPPQADMALLAAYVRQGQNAKALEVARGIVKKRPDDPASHLTLGSTLLLERDTAGARAALAKALEIDPAFLPAAARLAQLDLAEGKTADARARFESVLLKQPKNEAAMLGLAEVLMRSRAPTAEIAGVLRRALEAEPRSVAARVALIDLHLRERDGRAALAVAQETPAELAREPRMLDALGRAQVAVGDVNQAIETFGRAAAADPRSVIPLRRLAAVHAGRKDFPKALEVLQRAQKIAPSNPDVTRDLALSLVAMNRVDEALRQARALQAVAPRTPAGLLLEGDIHASQKRWPAAEKAYRDALKLDPDSTVSVVKLHAMLGATNRRSEATALASRWMAEHPGDDAFRGYAAEQALGISDPATAAELYRAIVGRQPNNAIALNNLAWALGQLDDPAALEYAERAMKLAPQNPAVLDTVGVLLTARGEAARGAEVLARAVALAPDRHDIRLNYAKALLKAGRSEDARRELVRLEGIPGNFAGRAEVAELLER